MPVGRVPLRGSVPPAERNVAVSAPYPAHVDLHDSVLVCTPEFTAKLPCVLIAPFASATDQTTVSAPGAFVVMAILNAVLFGKTRRPSVVGVSALMTPLAVPPAV